LDAKLHFVALYLYMCNDNKVESSLKGNSVNTSTLPYCLAGVRYTISVSSWYLGLVSSEGEGEVSVQQAVLLHEHHAVFVGVALSARDEAAGGPGNRNDPLIL